MEFLWKRYIKDLESYGKIIEDVVLFNKLEAGFPTRTITDYMTSENSQFDSSTQRSHSKRLICLFSYNKIHGPRYRTFLWMYSIARRMRLFFPFAAAAV